MLVLSDRVAETTLPSTFSQLTQLVDRRLAITQKGLAEAHRHLASGQADDAAFVLEKIDEDLHLLRRRVRHETERIATPRSSGLYDCASQSN